MHQPTIAKPVYYRVFVGLMALLALTAGAASLDLGAWHTIVALGIATMKALLIVLFFMHIRVSSRLTWVFAAAGFVWLSILLFLSMNDFLTRGYLHIAGK